LSEYLLEKITFWINSIKNSISLTKNFISVNFKEILTILILNNRGKNKNNHNEETKRSTRFQEENQIIPYKFYKALEKKYKDAESEAERAKALHYLDLNGKTMRINDLHALNQDLERK